MKRLPQRITALILLTVTPFFHACNRPGEDEHPSVSPNSETAFVIGSEGGEVTVTFTASHDWTAAPINDRADGWLTVSPSSGPAGNASMKLIAKENDSVDERNATIRINASTARLDVQLTQKQKNALTVSASKTEFGPAGGRFTIEVKSNVTYEVEMGKDCGWIRQAGTRGLVSTTLDFTVDANEEIQKREGEIIIKGEGLRETVHVYQDGSTPAIVLTKNDFTVSDKGEIIQVEVKSNIDVAVSIDGNASSWMEETSTRAMSTSTYYFKVAPNPGYDPRTGTITFTNTENHLSETVTVTQLQKDALIIGGGNVNFGVEGGSFEIQVRHNIDYEFTISADWIRKSKTRGLQEDVLIFMVDTNPTLEQRTGVISFTGQDAGGNDLKTDIEVIQEGEVRTLVLSEKEFAVSDKGETIEIQVTTNLELDIAIDKEAEEWIKQTSTKTVTTSSCFFQIAANAGYEPRTGIITFTDPASGMSETVTVHQLQKDALVVGPGTVNVEAEGGTIEITVGHNIDFEYSIEVDWLKKAPTRAFYEETLSFVAEANTSLDERRGTISFRGKDAGGKEMKTDVLVIQKGEDRTILLPVQEFTVSDKGETLEIEVSTNVELEVTVSKGAASWIEWVPTRTVTTQSYFFNISPNGQYETRSGQITFTDPDSGLSGTVTVNQLQKDALIVGPGTVNVEAEGGTIEITVGHNIDYSFEIGADWITSVSTRTFTEETLTFVAEANPTVDERTATIYFFGKDADGNDLTTDMLVTQAGQIPYVTVSVTDIDVYSRGEAFSFLMESNFEPSVASDADWIVFKGNDSTDPRRLLFEAKENTEEEDRVGSITFPSGYLEDPPTVTVRQKGTVNGLGYEKIGVYSLGDKDWAFTVGKDQILFSNAGSTLAFTLFNPMENLFFQTGGLTPSPEAGDLLDVKVIQNLSPLLDAAFNTTLFVESTDGAFAKLSSDKGFSTVVKTR